jgi:hypothetical protein
MSHAPGGLVGLYAEQPLQSLNGNTGFLGTHKEDEPKPFS